MPEGSGFSPEKKKQNKPKTEVGAEKARPTLEDLYALYDYKPPESLTQKKIEFTSLQVKEMSETLNKVLDMSMFEQGGFQRTRFANKTAFEVRYMKVDGTIQIRFFSAAGNLVASFDCGNKKLGLIAGFKENTQNWVLTHRLVSEEYRGQEIGSKILQVIENGVQHVSDRDQKVQTITIVAKQLGVINFALKNGYRPATPQDESNLNLIYSGDRSQVLVTTNPKLSLGDQERPGFVYSIPQLKKYAHRQRKGALTTEKLEKLDVKKFLGSSFDSHVLCALNVVFVKEKQPLVKQE